MNKFQEMLKRDLNEKVGYNQANLMEESNYYDWLYNFFLKTKNGIELYRRKTQGTSSMKIEKVFELLGPLIGKPIYIATNTHAAINSSYYFLDVKNISFFVEITKSESLLDEVSSYNITIWSDNENFSETFIKKAKSIFEVIDQQKVFVVSTGRNNGLTLTSLGKLNYAFIRDNYEDEILEHYDYALGEFNKSHPYGRLVIANGPAGSGKTNLLKGMMMNLKKTLIVLLPAKFVIDIDSPSIISMLLKEKQDQYGALYEDAEEGADLKKPQETSITFIIEDGDQCLVPRGPENLSAISSMLNYTDGIFGSMLNIRMIVSTNAAKMEFDPALVRSGRLCRHIFVDALSPEKASSVYKRLSEGKEKKYTEKTTLSDVYADVHGGFRNAKTEKAAPVGFGK